MLWEYGQSLIQTTKENQPIFLQVNLKSSKSLIPDDLEEREKHAWKKMFSDRQRLCNIRRMPMVPVYGVQSVGKGVRDGSVSKRTRCASLVPWSQSSGTQKSIPNLTLIPGSGRQSIPQSYPLASTMHTTMAYVPFPTHTMYSHIRNIIIF